MMRSVSTPARIASGLPPKVVPWLPGPKTFAACAAGPRRRRSARPSPGPWPAASRRARMPAHWCANHLPVRPMPHCTSSSISSQSLLVAQLAQACAGSPSASGGCRLRPGSSRGTPPPRWGCSRATCCTRRQVVQRHAHEAFDQRAEAGLDLRVAGGRQRGDRAAVEGALVDDDLRPLDAAGRGRTCARSSARLRWLPGRCCRRRRWSGRRGRTACAASVSCSGTW